MEDKEYNSEKEDWNSENDKKREEEESDDFGLPDVSYDPLERDKSESEDDFGLSEGGSHGDKKEEDDYNDNYGQGYRDEGDYREEYRENEYSESRNRDEEYRDEFRDEPKEEYRDEYRDNRYDNDDTDNTGKVLLWIFIILIVLGGLAALYFFVLKDQINPEPEVVEQTTDQSMFEQEQTDEPEVTGQEEQPQETPPAQEQPPADAETAAPETGGQGTISTISSRTGRYYVVIGSFVDDDLAIDYGRNLTAQGLNAYLIEPYGNVNFYRLAVDQIDSWSAAENRLEELKSRFGNDIWVLKY